MKEKRASFKIPDSVKAGYKGKCSCGGFKFVIDGQEICGKCSIEQRKKEYLSNIPADSILTEYYRSKKGLAPADGDCLKDRAFKD